MGNEPSRSLFGLPKRDFGDGEQGAARYAANLLALLSVTLTISALSGGLLNVSFPVVVRHFDASATAASWLILSAMLASTTLIVMWGRLADMFGRIPIFMGGLALMTLTSILAGLSPSIGFLIVVRVVQAGGSAMLLAVMAAMLTVSTPTEKLSRYMGIYMSALASASLAGPPLGALLAETVGWRWLFWFQAPFGVVLIVWAAMTLRPMPAVGERGRMDIAGVLLLGGTLTGLIVALSRLQTKGITNPLVLIGFAAFLACLPAFVLVETRRASPLVDLRLFRKKSVAASNAAMLFGNMARNAVVLIAGLYFQAVDGNSTLEAAFKVLPLPLATTAAGFFMGRISRWGTQQAIATWASAVSAVGILVLMPAFSQGMAYPVMFAGLFVAGFGGGVFMPANTTAILQEVPRERLGVVNAVRMMLMFAGGVIATALSLALITSAVAPGLRSAVFAGTVSHVSGGAVASLRTGYLRAILVLNLLNVIGIIAAGIAQRAHRRGLGEPGGPHEVPPAPSP
ncbi:MAG: MFS transporter, partial [Frankiaceae bacterium]|nr:MFS transporter [Frankiaceae bacterium]